jgi:hypothetical protein
MGIDRPVLQVHNEGDDRLKRRDQVEPLILRAMHPSHRRASVTPYTSAIAKHSISQLKEVGSTFRFPDPSSVRRRHEPFSRSEDRGSY